VAAEPDADRYPSAATLQALSKLLRKRMSKKDRAREAWSLLLQAGLNSDFAVVADFVVENDLALPVADSAVVPQGTRVPTWVNPVDGSEMVWIPAGPFFVGEEPMAAHAGGFSLARYPVTNERFALFLKETGYRPPEWHPEPETFLAHWKDGQVPKGREEHPVVFVSLVDALSYCRWAGLTLPTEWLWEKAARGPDGRRFPGGDSFPWGNPKFWKPQFRPPANVCSDDTVAVGSYPRARTAYGCEDMTGNVSQWCLILDESAYGRLPPPEAEVPDAAPVKGTCAAVRGGCILRVTQKALSTWHRRRLSVTRRNRWVGFRPACVLGLRPAT
jgi:serine/threonine-protein kinase